MHHVPLSEDMVLGTLSIVGQFCTIEIFQRQPKKFYQALKDASTR